jgi:tetratricopeptide (TPR) repeat protein
VRNKYENAEAVEFAAGLFRRFATWSWARKRLGLVLYFRAAQLTAEGRFEDALVPAEESVELLRQTLPADPAWVGPRYVMALGLYAGVLHQCDWMTKALAASEEVLRIERRLDRGRPLADALHDHGLFLGELGRTEEGLRALDEALRRYRELPDPTDEEIAKAEQTRDQLREDS